MEELKQIFNGKKLSFEEFCSAMPATARLVNGDEWVARSELTQAQTDRRIDTALAQGRVKNITAARALLDLNGIYADPDSIPTQLAQMKQQNPYLFEEGQTQATGLQFTQSEPLSEDMLSDADYYNMKLKGTSV